MRHVVVALIMSCALALAACGEEPVDWAMNGEACPADGDCGQGLECVILSVGVFSRVCGISCESDEDCPSDSVCPVEGTEGVPGGLCVSVVE